MRSRLFSRDCPHSSRLARWFTLGLGSVLAPALATLGCRDGAESPTAPQSAAEAPVQVLATAVAGALSFREISAGDNHTCGITTDDRAYCWGGVAGPLTPTPVAGGLRFLEVSAGPSDRHGGGLSTCGVTKTQRAYCWGPDLTPEEVPGGRRFRQVSTGLEYACGVTPGDVAFCWGDNRWVQLGTGGGFYSAIPVRVAGGLRFRRVFAAGTHTCGATTDDRAYCWGNNVFGQLGDGSLTFEQPKPVAVAGGLRFRQVKPGSGYPSGIQHPEIDLALSCGVTTDDRAYCWGSTALGSEIAQSRTPVPVAGGRRFNFVHPGLWHACALTPSDVAFCWGTNDEGQLGTGALGGFSMTPARVAGGLRFVGLTVAATGLHTCGVTADHRAYCWGWNLYGQLGDGTRTARPTPVAVAGAMP